MVSWVGVMGKALAFFFLGLASVCVYTVDSCWGDYKAIGFFFSIWLLIRV